MHTLTHLADRIGPRLQFLYGARGDDCLARLLDVCRKYSDLGERSHGTLWDERDVVLITYGDQVSGPNQTPLQALCSFLGSSGLDQSFSLLHILPFFPATSDDGFSVADYRAVAPELGTWDDIEALRGRLELMFDLVLNHASSESDWFRKYLGNIEPYSKFFIEANPSLDWSDVVRPRTSPLLTPVETAHGLRYVWTTFSADQVDLNFAEPNVLVEILDILLDYIRRGARIVRLDAVAFVWKEAGTNCVHRPQTHQIVKLLRDVLDELAPGTLLLTETNVPHAENTGYWGDGDEAHLIYNFSLPPLLLDALLTGDGTYFQRWLAGMPESPDGTNLLNFTASHDGIGLRPLEELVPHDRLVQLVDAMKERGGKLSYRVGKDGRELPYELNITWFDALRDPNQPENSPGFRRCMASQAIMLSLPGIPAVYFHSVFGTPNDNEGVARTGRARSINRRKFQLNELHRMIEHPTSEKRVFDEYRRLLSVRRKQKAFHPDSSMHLFDSSDPSLLAFVRGSKSWGQTLFVAINLAKRSKLIHLPTFGLKAAGADLLSETPHGLKQEELVDDFVLEPYQVIWVPVDQI